MIASALLWALLACSSSGVDGGAGDLVPALEDFGAGWEVGEAIDGAPEPYERTVIGCIADGFDVGDSEGVGLFFVRRPVSVGQGTVSPIGMRLGSADEAAEAVETMKSSMFTACLDERAAADPVNGVFFGDYNYVAARLVDEVELRTEGADLDEALYLGVEFTVAEPDGTPATPIGQGFVVARRGALLQVTRFSGLDQEGVDDAIAVLLRQF